MKIGRRSILKSILVPAAVPATMKNAIADVSKVDLGSEDNPAKYMYVFRIKDAPIAEDELYAIEEAMRSALAPGSRFLLLPESIRLEDVREIEE